MRRKTEPVTHDIVLVGGGHSHVQVMTDFAMNPVKGVRLTLVTERLLTPYSGMLPGCVAGLYTIDDIHIDLWRLARATGTRLIFARATGLDRAAKRVLIEGRPPLPYDIASLNLGITPDVSAIDGAAEHALLVKPIASFLPRLSQMIARLKHTAAPHVAVVGGGAAGAELAMALHARLRQEGVTDARISLISAADLVPSLNEGVRQRLKAALQQRFIAFRLNQRVKAITADALEFEDGESMAVDAVIASTHAKLADWAEDAGLPLYQGSIAIRPSLQLTDDDAVFAVGDCAIDPQNPREKAGVFAVRQGPVLAKNLRALVRGQALRAYKPQKQFLTLIATGDGEAIGGRGKHFAISGAWVWRWKDRIDRRFMAMFSRFGADMAKPATEEDYASGDAMLCAGCAAKVGPDPLKHALARLPQLPPPHDMLVHGVTTPDDAVVVALAKGVLQVESIDFLTAFIEDPFLFGEIAAMHALSDIYATGGVPTRAMAMAQVQHGNEKVTAQQLHLLLAGARHALDAEHVTLTSGHSLIGETMGLGFAMMGSIASAAIKRKQDLRAGQSLILTKPIGTGVLFAADMRGAARGEWVMAALDSMRHSNRMAAEILSKATALTDITGFGLGGHILEMLADGAYSADLFWDQVPLYSGAGELAAKGFQSSLYAANSKSHKAVLGWDSLSDAERALLFDPQTSGGLLAAIDEGDAQTALAALLQSGHQAAVIGTVTERHAGSIIIRR